MAVSTVVFGLSLVPAIVIKTDKALRRRA